MFSGIRPKMIDSLTPIYIREVSIHEEKLTINELSEDVLRLILMHLNHAGLQQANSVCKKWHCWTIDIAKHQDKQLQEFSSFILDHVEMTSHSLLVKELHLFLEKSFSLDSAQNSTHLKQLQQNYLPVEDDLLSKIKQLSLQELEKLQNTSRELNSSIIFDDLFELTKIYIKLEDIEKKINLENRKFKLEKSEKISMISKEFAQKGRIGKATEIAYKIEHEIQKSSACTFIVKTLISTGQIQGAINIVCKWSVKQKNNKENEDIVFKSFREIVDNLFLFEQSDTEKFMNFIDKAMHVVEKINDTEQKQNAFDLIFCRLVEKKQIKKLVELFPKSPNKKDTLIKVKEQTKKTRLETLVEVTLAMSLVWVVKDELEIQEKSRALSSVAKELNMKGYRQEAYEIASLMPDKIQKKYTFDSFK